MDVLLSIPWLVCHHHCRGNLMRSLPGWAEQMYFAQDSHARAVLECRWFVPLPALLCLRMCSICRNCPKPKPNNKRGQNNSKPSLQLIFEAKHFEQNIRSQQIVSIRVGKALPALDAIDTGTGCYSRVRNSNDLDLWVRKQRHVHAITRLGFALAHAHTCMSTWIGENTRSCDCNRP